MAQIVKTEAKMQFETNKQTDPNQQFSGLYQFQDCDFQNNQQEYLDYKQHNNNLPNNFENPSNQINYQQLITNSLNYSPSNMMDFTISQPPVTPLRFSEVQKSIQVLRRAIPHIMNDALVDKIYKTLLGNANNNAQTYPQSYPKANIKKFLPSPLSHKATKSKQRKITKDETQANEDKVDKQNFQDKIRIFNQTENGRALQKTKNMDRRKTQRRSSDNGKRLASIWTEQMQNDFIEQYRKRYNMHDIRLFLIKKYPQYEQYFTYAQVRGQGYKIMRLALRKLYFLIANCQEIKLPELLKITQIRSNFIYYFKQGVQVRCYLAELYKLEEFNYEFLSKLILTINNLCFTMEQDQMVMSKIGHKKGRTKTKPSGNYELNQSKVKKNDDFFYQDDSIGEQPTKYGYFQKK